MRWTRVAPTVLVAFSLAAVVLQSCTQAQKVEVKPAAMTQEQKVERGKYLVSVLGCNDCHTPGSFYGSPDMTRMLSGSELGWKGPWGVSFPRNLTPDPETGIGSWTEDQIVAALTKGQRPDGRTLLPPMPWPIYANLTADDAASVAAFLKTIPPVKHTAPDIVPPNGKYTGAAFVLPPPPAWDAPKTPPAGADTTHASRPGGAAPSSK